VIAPAYPTWWSRSLSRFATVGDAMVSRGSRDGCTSHSPRTRRTTDRTHVTPDHHNPILRLASAPSRRSAALRPRHAGLAALTGHSVEPRTSFYVMVGQPVVETAFHKLKTKTA